MDENTGPTPAELVEMVAAMTPGKWAGDGYILADEDEGVADVFTEEDARGIVALRNHFPALMERYERMRAALERIACSERFDGIARAALADADKPLTMEPVASFANVARSNIEPSTAQE